MTAYRELIERLEKATGPDRDLDADLVRFALGTIREDWFIAAIHDGLFRPFTASIDAALALVEKMLPRQMFDMEVYRDREAGLVTVGILHRMKGGLWNTQQGRHRSEPVATCIALLRALEAQSKDKEEGAA